MKTLFQNSNRWLFCMAFVAAVSLLASTAPAAERIIEGQAGNQWAPKALPAAVGDVLEWKIAGGFHGVRITNWAAIKDHVEVETVAGQHPFDATTGQNAVGTGTAGQVLLRLKIKTLPPAPGKITYDCIVHGPGMAGEVTITAPALPVTVKTIEGQAGNQWNPNALPAAVGEVIEWKIGGGFHGVRITNWAAIKDHVEVETVAGQHPFDSTTGQNAVGTGTAGQVLLRLKIKTAPPAPGKIAYDCVVHGPPMNGEVTITAPAPPVTVKTIEGQAGNQWNPNALPAAVGEVIEWKIGGGFHGVRITNWAAIKDHVEVETVAGQHPFDSTTGQNAVGTGTAGQVLLRLKIKTAPPAPGKIAYDCVVHGPPMNGEVTIAAGPTVKIIEALQPPQWNPAALDALVGDVFEWKITAGNHGVRITNWAAIKDHVEVETVAGQQPFNATTGQNDAPSNTTGTVLLRLKIKTAPPAPGKITYNCIVHGVGMAGEVTVAAPAPQVTVIEALQSSEWHRAALNAAVGEVLEWRVAGGVHGLRISNWAAIKDHVEVETVPDQMPFNATTGQNDTPTSAAGKLLLRLKIKSTPPAPGKITYNCIVHPMIGEVTIGGVLPKVIVAEPPEAASVSWSPAALNAVVGEAIEWKLGVGAHGMRITNWAVVKDHVEIETVPGQQPFDATAGENEVSTTLPNKLLLRLKIRSAPPGGKILFECIVRGGLMIGEIRVGSQLLAGPQVMMMEAPILQAPPKPVEKWAATFPKVLFTKQDGKEVNFYEEIKGKTVIINFMYTTCDGNCGVAMRALIQIQKALGDRLGREVFIYSITLDPQTDTPTVLREYAEAYGVKPGPGWTFLTGNPEAIEALRKKFGVASLSAEMRRKLNLKEVDAAEADRKQHAAVLIIGNEAFNRWRTAPILYRPDQILQIIERMKPPQSSPPPQ